MSKPTRPYLLVEFTQRAREGVNTSQKGWMDDPKNLATYERVSVVDRLNNKSQMASIIIDLVEGSVLKSSVDKEHDVLVAHYIDKYEEMIRQSMLTWARREVSEGIKSGASDAGAE